MLTYCQQDPPPHYHHHHHHHYILLIISGATQLWAQTENGGSGSDLPSHHRPWPWIGWPWKLGADLPETLQTAEFGRQSAQASLFVTWQGEWREPFYKWLNSLTPWGCVSDFKSVISEHKVQNKFMNAYYKITLRWMPQNILWIFLMLS